MALIGASITGASAQRYIYWNEGDEEKRGKPTEHDKYAEYYLMAGYQYLSHPTGVYQVGTIQAEMLYSFFGTRVGFTYGPDYMSFSAFGILLFTPHILMESLEGEAAMIALPVMLASLSAGFIRFPLTNHLEATVGWDALKFTKLKNFADKFYVTGSLNAGLTYFIGNHFFVNGYYEFNHTHNPIISLLNKAEVFGYINDQPGELKGHSFGARIGWMF